MINTENLRRILEGIWSGELEHNQANFFCGTACCVAGWDVALNSGLNAPAEKRAEWHIDFINKSPYNVPWSWSQKYNGLNFMESDLLYDSPANYVIHSLMLKAFEAGRRYTPPDNVSTYYSCRGRSETIGTKEDYFTSSAIICLSLTDRSKYSEQELMEPLLTFLNPDPSHYQVLLSTNDQTVMLEFF